jgi:hypothetical protein
MLRPELRLTVSSFGCTAEFPLHETFGPEYIGLFSSHAKVTRELHLRYFVPVFHIFKPVRRQMLREKQLKTIFVAMRTCQHNRFCATLRANPRLYSN